MTLTLTRDELLQAVIVGGNRRITSLQRKTPPLRRDHFLSEDNSEWSSDIESCAAEITFARLIDRYWSAGVFDGSIAKSDVAGCQVRHTQHADGHLLLYTEDEDEDIFVLVTGRSPTFTVVGWCRGHEGKKSRFWKAEAKAPCFWVPQSELRQIDKEA